MDSSLFRYFWLHYMKIGESGLVGLGVIVRIGRFLVQTPLVARLGLGNHPCYKAPSDPWVKNVKQSD